MWQLLLKALMSAAVVVAVAEAARRSTLWGALLASLPLTSLLAFLWLYLDTGDVQRIALLSRSIFWLVLPSLLLFILLPWLLRHGLGFWLGLALASAATVSAYLAMLWCLGRLGVRV